jgi:hypothetical protein
VRPGDGTRASRPGTVRVPFRDGGGARGPRPGLGGTGMDLAPGGRMVIVTPAVRNLGSNRPSRAVDGPRDLPASAASPPLIPEAEILVLDPRLDRGVLHRPAPARNRVPSRPLPVPAPAVEASPN